MKLISGMPRTTTREDVKSQAIQAAQEMLVVGGLVGEATKENGDDHEREFSRSTM
jgi:hypothetical protein